ncbi:hypothetical protein DY000_02014285 [Brassica cretica]|uniref:Uncharacterized protein n=1 Tax=Brassica cretica TaxID=69181 RepID=A0ABQ7CYX0_BRACR|nr:hypothetical protein DY000_02014285 [Brassica cretica]
MEEMKQDTARIQNATDVARPPSIDRRQPPSIDIRPPVETNKKQKQKRMVEYLLGGRVADDQIVVAPMNLPMYQTRYMVHAPLTLQLTSAHDSLALSTNVHKLLQRRSPLFLLNRRPIFALLHFGLIRNKYGRWYGPPVRTSPYFRTITQLSPNALAFVVSESLACRPSLSLPVHSHHLVPTTQKTPPFFIHQPANSFGSSFPLHQGRLAPYWLAKGSHEPALVFVQIQGHYSFFFTDHTAHRQPVLAPASSLSSSLQILFCLLLLRTILCPIFAPTPNRLRWSSHELPDRSGPYVPYGLALNHLWIPRDTPEGLALSLYHRPSSPKLFQHLLSSLQFNIKKMEMLQSGTTRREEKKERGNEWGWFSLISCIFTLFYPFTHVHFDHID